MVGAAASAAMAWQYGGLSTSGVTSEVASRAASSPGSEPASSTELSIGAAIASRRSNPTRPPPVSSAIPARIRAITAPRMG